MNTLSEQLTELYNEKWSDLMEQLEANGLRRKRQSKTNSKNLQRR